MNEAGAVKIARGDWQTPAALAVAALDVALAGRPAPRTVAEPTCGLGAFLVAARSRLPAAALLGWDIDAGYVRAARCSLPGARIEVADFFATDWTAALAGAAEPILVIGNPPWVTSARLGALGATNAPAKRSDGLSGLDARTGKSNFDVSEWMIVRLLEALQGRDATLAVLCKAAVARKIVITSARRGLLRGGVLRRIDAQAHFGAAVEAVLLVAHTKAAVPGWRVHASLAAKRPEVELVVEDGVLLADARAFARTRHLVGVSVPEWRSGMKHDCARVMELSRSGPSWVNGLDEAVDIEEAVLHPFLKSSDVAQQRPVGARAVIVPQRALGEDTRALRRTAPRAWRYLTRHRALLAARQSSIYEGQAPYAIFGIGEYSFAPWKVAISGLYKDSPFLVVGPYNGRSVLLDDTCYFLSFASERAARGAATALSSSLAQDFFAARVFRDAKRPLTKGILQTLDLVALKAAIRVRR